MEKTANAQGQAIREAETYGQVMRVIQASVGDLSGILGEALLPIFRAVGQGFINALPAMNQFADAISYLFSGFDWSYLEELIEGIVEGFVDFGTALMVMVTPFIYALGGVLQVVTDVLNAFGLEVDNVSGIIRPLAAALAPVFIGFVLFKAGAVLYATGAKLVAAYTTLMSASIPIWGLIAVAITAVVAVFASLYSAMSETTANAKKEMEELKKQTNLDGLGDKLKDFSKNYEDLQKQTAKPFQFKIEGVTEQSVAGSIASSVDSAFAKLAQQAGGVGLINEEVREQYEEYQRVMEVVNRLIAAGNVQAEDYQYLNEEAKKFLELTQKQSEELKKQDAAAKALSKSYEDAVKVVGKLVEASLTPQQKTARDYADQMRAISLYLQQAQEKLNSARRAGDAASIAAAEKQLELAEKNVKIASGEAEKQRRESYLEGMGFNMDDFKKQTSEIERLSSVVQEFNRGILTGSEVRNYVENTANDVVNWFRQIKEQTQEIADENLKAMDTRTAEGLEEFFRLASGQDDPALEAEKEQIAQLKKINKQLKGTGLTVATIAGA
jgi:uncharacterized membrane protein YfbV (UPF0208 family)